MGKCMAINNLNRDRAVYTHHTDQHVTDQSYAKGIKLLNVPVIKNVDT